MLDDYQYRNSLQGYLIVLIVMAAGIIVSYLIFEQQNMNFFQQVSRQSQLKEVGLDVAKIQSRR